MVPFGLSSAPKLFTKGLRPLVKYWRNSGLKIVVFLDDGWGVNKDFSSTKKDSDFVLETLQKCGFLVNMDKSVFIPAQVLQWLGLMWDLKNGVIAIPTIRIENTKNCIMSILHAFPWVSARCLAKLAGKLMSMGPVLGNVSLIKTKQFFRVIEARTSWNGVMNINTCHA